VQNRSEKTKFANIVLLAKRLNFFFRYSYVAIHIFTAFTILIPQTTKNTMK